MLTRCQDHLLTGNIWFVWYEIKKRFGQNCTVCVVKGYLWVQGSYLWVQRGYLSVLGGYLGGWVNLVDGGRTIEVTSVINLEGLRAQEWREFVYD